MLMDGSARYIALDPSDDADAERGRSVALLLAEAREDAGAAGAAVVPVTAAPRVDRVEVIAPASLPGGYELPCDFRGRSVTVEVVRRLFPFASCVPVVGQSHARVALMSYSQTLTCPGPWFFTF
jgi:hypothetical protein